HAKNLVGYHNLVRLVSEAHINGYYYNPRIDHELLEKYHEGLHCSSACIAGEIAYYLDTSLKGGNNPKKAEEIALWYKNLFGDDYSLEVMLHPSGKGEGDGKQIPPAAVDEFHELYARQRDVANAVIALGKKLGIRVIATNDVHFLEKEDDDSHDVLLALSTGTKLSDPNRMIYTGQEYFKTEEEMRELFHDHPEVVDATEEVAGLIEEYELNSDPIMPKFPIPAEFGSEEEYAKKFDEAALRKEFNTEDKPKNFERLGGYEKVLRIKFEADYLQSLVYEGMKRRWGDPTPAEIVERVDFELGVIKTMGFPGYFLIVNDYIANARKMGVWVGPGRGSAAGAAVAYALGITNVDPIKYDLLFERFLNPDRISMPDIDVDFDDAGRGKVLEFVTKKYGADHVAHIVTFGQMAAKSVIKDVGRVMDYPLADTNKLAGLVPETPKITFKKATSTKDKNGNPNGDYSQGLVDAFNSEDETVHLLMERARRLEGGMRQPGVHACGVIISRDPLTETLPVMPTEGESLLTTQYDGHFVEPVGLLKMDFLGLKTLTVEKECVAILGPNNPRVPEALRGPDGLLDPDKIPDDDKETYELFGRGETTGLFQFESDGMKKWLMALQPERLTDLVAMNALYRPGPMEYIPTFVRRKKGEEEIVYDHPLMEKYLKDTYGVCVYQEQVMLLSRLLGGFTRGMSDALRKAMGKKKLDVMEELKVKFVDGCLKNPEFRVGKWADETEARTLIDKIWNDWRAFASYAFNKSHAVCYAWVAYQTGYMKAHYPAEFMCAQISSEIGNFDKLPGFVAEAQEMGLELKLPDVNESGSRFVPTPDAKGIRYGLSGIKGVGNAGDAIVEERRKNGPYAGFLDFCLRLAGTQACNKRVLENLTRTCAFDSFEPNRAKLFNNIEYALKKAQGRAKEKASAQTSFFDLMDGGEEKVSDRELADSPAFSPAEDLKNERDMLGVYVSGHPLQSCRRVISEVATFKTAQLKDTESVDAMLKGLPVDKWKKKSNPNLKDERALKHLDVRLVGILSACTVKMPKPRPDGTVGQKWAILQIDDGTVLDAFCFAKAWEQFGAKLETAVDKLVLLSGEVAYRINYEKDDKFEKKNPTVGDLNFTVKEAYPLEDALPLLSKGLRITMQYEDPEIKPKVNRIRDAIKKNPGTLPVIIELHYPSGKVLDVDLGPEFRVAGSISFLSELSKILPQTDTTFRPSDKVYLAPREPKPWER
ncbi:MAG: DNA polymerase III subunit alpha, partial [Kiritimatiellae bacterium]|nr:DNA polymerase III subunit alpha [Kiritimatiellia bacterium]